MPYLRHLFEDRRRWILCYCSRLSTELLSEASMHWRYGRHPDIWNYEDSWYSQCRSLCGGSLYRILHLYYDRKSAPCFYIVHGADGTIGVLVHKCLYGPILAKPHILPIIPLITSVGLFTLTGDLVRLICGSGNKSIQRRAGIWRCSPGK